MSAKLARLTQFPDKSSWNESAFDHIIGSKATVPYHRLGKIEDMYGMPKLKIHGRSVTIYMVDEKNLRTAF